MVVLTGRAKVVGALHRPTRPVLRAVFRVRRNTSSGEALIQPASHAVVGRVATQTAAWRKQAALPGKDVPRAKRRGVAIGSALNRLVTVGVTRAFCVLG